MVSVGLYSWYVEQRKQQLTLVSSHQHHIEHHYRCHDELPSLSPLVSPPPSTPTGRLIHISAGIPKRSKAKLMSECDQELATVLFSREKDKNRTTDKKPTKEADAIRQRCVCISQIFIFLSFGCLYIF